VTRTVLALPWPWSHLGVTGVTLLSQSAKPQTGGSYLALLLNSAYFRLGISAAAPSKISAFGRKLPKTVLDKPFNDLDVAFSLRLG
jgi:hypothetical protein